MAEPDETTTSALPDDIADAWAAVLIDVYEKQQADRSESCTSSLE